MMLKKSDKASMRMSNHSQSNISEIGKQMMQSQQKLEMQA